MQCYVIVDDFENYINKIYKSRKTVFGLHAQKPAGLSY